MSDKSLNLNYGIFAEYFLSLLNYLISFLAFPCPPPKTKLLFLKINFKTSYSKLKFWKYFAFFNVQDINFYRFTIANYQIFNFKSIITVVRVFQMLFSIILKTMLFKRWEIKNFIRSLDR